MQAAWWQLQSGGCRSGYASLNYDFSVAPAGCLGIFLDYTRVLGVSQAEAGTGGANRLRIKGGCAVPPEDAQTIADDGIEYGVVQLNILRSRTIGAAPCAGCNTGACIVLNEIKLLQPATVALDYRIQNPAQNNAITYNPASAAPVCPGAVPTQNRTWGAVKSLYR